jgi:hypothetical protein
MVGTSTPRVPASPVLRPISWGGALQTLLGMGVFVGGGHFLVGPPWGIVVGATCYLFYRSLVVRGLFCRDHVAGIHALARGEVKVAAEYFAASERVWRGRRLVDRWRAFLLGSAGPYDFLTLARYNRAFCLARLRRRDEALVILEALLAEDPDNGLAFTLRDLLLAGEPAEEDGEPPASRA